MRPCRFLHFSLFRLEFQVSIWLRFSSLSHSKGSSPPWDHWEGNTSQDEARKDSDGKNILFDFVMAGGICESEDDVLNLVIYPTACLKRAGLRIQREIVEVCLE